MTKYKLEYFDLETAALPLEILRPRMPEFTAPSQWKDPVKIAQAIEEKQNKWLDECALSPLTGQILAAVWVDMEGKARVIDADSTSEGAVIEFIFDRFRNAGQGAHYKVAGFNIAEFDIPWLIKRAWACGVEIPTGIFKLSRKWFDLPPWMIDIRHLWGMGESYAKGDLGRIAEFLGVGEKRGTGDNFAKLWRDPMMHAEALAYILNDGNLLPAILEYLLGLTDDQYGLNLQRKIQPK